MHGTKFVRSGWGCTALSLLLLLAGASASAQQQPDWLGTREDSATTEDTDRAPAQPPPPPKEEAQPSWSGGPFLEEFVIRPNRPPTPTGEPGTSDLTIGPSRAGDESGVDPNRSRYGVQPSDVLTISVWREPELQREVTVSPDGWISFPLIGELHVEDRTIDEIRTEIEEKLGRLIPDAVASVSLRQVLGNRVYVLGNVNAPGMYSFSKRLDVIQALSLAGGTSKFAAADDIKILRRQENGIQRAFDFNYSLVRRGKQLGQNILLQSGDVVMVP